MGKSVKGVALMLMHQRSKSVFKYKPIDLDKRFKFNRDVLSYIKNNPFSDEYVNAINLIRRARLQLKPKSFTSIYDNPIVKDYINNKNAVVTILPNRILFRGGRNHWAKTDQDLRVLKLLIEIKNR